MPSQASEPKRVKNTLTPFVSVSGLFRSLSSFVLAALGVALAAQGPPPDGEIRIVGDAIEFQGFFQPEVYRNHPVRFHGHHAITYLGGSMAPKALITTEVPDRKVAEFLSRLGLDSAGGIPAKAWSLKDDPGANEPDLRAQGTRLHVLIRFKTAKKSDWIPLQDLLSDHGEPSQLDLRFADNRQWIDLYQSGCIVCLSSCPGSKIANHNYTIRENDQGPMDFLPVGDVAKSQPVAIRIGKRKPL